MDGASHASAPEETPLTAVRRAQVSHTDNDPAAALCAQLGGASAGLQTVFLFVTPRADFQRLTDRAATVFAGADVIACTTAGEIGAAGYEDDQIVALGLPGAHFASSSVVIEDLGHLEAEAVSDRVVRARLDLHRRRPDMAHSFAFLLVDGLSLGEDTLAAAVSAGLGTTPFFGGSAADGTAFTRTRLSLNGTVHEDAGIVTLVKTHCPVRVFSLDHLTPTDDRMVVTRAHPEARIVEEINAEPAAREYARILGKDPHQLDPFTFAAHPVVVRLGGRHHVRAIQRVTEDGKLVFFSAIDEGMVLTLAEAQDMAGHLDGELSRLNGATAPEAILACDCILRRLEAGQKQLTRTVSATLAAHNVIGFNTYGEQIGPLHINQTLTGVAIYPPNTAPHPAEDTAE